MKGRRNHTTIARTRRLIDLETHRQVFAWVLELLADAGLVKGKRIGIDATTLEANAALRSIVRRGNAESYEEFLTGLARESGVETPTREDLARVDRKRKMKGSNREWVNPHDQDASITKMKDRRAHLAHKAEHAVDMDTGAVVAVTLQEAHLGDTTTLTETLAEAGIAIAELIEREAEAQPLEKPQVNLRGIEEVVADKGYHSGPVLQQMQSAGVRTYIPEKKQAGKRHWVGIVAMEGNGPLHGTHRHLGKIVLSDDPVAADFTCARLMGLYPEGVWHLDHAARFFGNGSADRIVLLAEGLPERMVPFNVLPQFAYLRMPVPSR